jgi:hypothetical protein
MEQFNIIGALEAYAISKGWHFVYRFDNFQANIGAMTDYSPEQLVLCADFRGTPTYSGSKIGEIRYECLIMLGRKFDADGTASSLDETMMQKYDRRLKELAQLLAGAIADFSCQNNLEALNGAIAVDINLYDTNIDFAIVNNQIFIQ